MSVYYIGDMPVSDELYHHGIKGQHWGIRRYQNPDGSLTAAGKARYGTVENFNKAQEMKKAKSSTAEAQTRKEKIKKGAKIGLAIVGTGLAVYGGYKLSKLINDKNSQYAIDIAKRKIRNAEDSRKGSINMLLSGGYDLGTVNRNTNRINSIYNKNMSNIFAERDRTLNSNIVKKATNAYRYIKSGRH